MKIKVRVSGKLKISLVVVRFSYSALFGGSVVLVFGSLSGVQV